MKYAKEPVVSAEYTNPQGNPFLEALPELLGKKEFVEQMKSDIRFPYDLIQKSSQERRNHLTELTQWFWPMDYMYTLYDMLFRAMAATYQTKTTIESVRQLNEIHMDFRTGRERTRSYSTQAYSGAVLGVPGIGKTSTIQRCLSTMPQVVIHTQYQGTVFYTKQINYLVVECPSDCSVKTLAFNIISGIDRAIGSDYIGNGNALKTLSSSALTAKLKIICMSHHIGLIVIDEIQNAITTAAKNKQMKPLIKFLVELTNETSTGICFCGTLEAEELFLKQEHLKRRTRGLRLLPMKYDATYRKFITGLWEYQVTLQKADLTEKLMKQMYDLSGGIPAYLVKLFMEAQTQAMLSGKEKLSYETIKQAVTMLNMEVPKNYSRGGTSISEFVVNEVEFEELGGNEIGAVAEGKRMEVAGPGVEDVEVIPDKPMKIKDMELQKQKEPQELSEPPTEHTTKPIRRFYASQRGRTPTEREKADLLAIGKQNGTGNDLVQTLVACQMVERRSY